MVGSDKILLFRIGGNPVYWVRGRGPVCSKFNVDGDVVLLAYRVVRSSLPIEPVGLGVGSAVYASEDMLRIAILEFGRVYDSAYCVEA